MSVDYEYLNESSIDDNLKCSICNDPFKIPYVTPCDHTFCYKCIEQQIKYNRSCPICRQRIVTTEDLIPIKTRLILNILDGLLVKCKICNKKGIQRGEFNSHLKICRKEKQCLCSAADIRCPWIGRPDQLSLHIKQCPYEEIRPMLMGILTENRHLKAKVDQYENELRKHSAAKQLPQKRQQLENNNHSTTTNSKHSIQSSIVRPITFEFLLTQSKLGVVPNGYAGLNWFNVRYTNEENARAIRSDRYSDRISVFSRGYSCIIYNDWKYPMIISAIRKPFTLYACEIMSTNGLEKMSKLNIIGRKNRIPIYSKIVLLEYNISKIIEFQSWINLDEIEFSIPNNYFVLTWIQLGD